MKKYNYLFTARIFLPLLLFAITGITGCVAFTDQTTTVVLQHPETMDFVDCKVGEWPTDEAYARKNRCVEEYRNKGYIIWGER